MIEATLTEGECCKKLRTVQCKDNDTIYNVGIDSGMRLNRTILTESLSKYINFTHPKFQWYFSILDFKLNIPCEIFISSLCQMQLKMTYQFFSLWAWKKVFFSISIHFFLFYKLFFIQPGDSWRSEENSCIKQACVQQEDGSVLKDITQETCDETCSLVSTRN